MVNQIIGAVELGLVYGLMVLGVFITFRILKIPDLTVDGSVTLGMAVCAMLTNAGHPLLAIIIAFIAGLCAGSVTGFFQTKIHIPPILAGILTMSGLYSINLKIMSDGKPSRSSVVLPLPAGPMTIYHGNCHRKRRLSRWRCRRSSQRSR